MVNQTTIEVFDVELKRRFAKDFLDLLILQLVQSRPTWGYEIIKRTEARHGVRLRHGALYPMLKTLKKKGFILCRKELEKRRIRKIYEISPSGKKLLQVYSDFLSEQMSNMNIESGRKRE